MQLVLVLLLLATLACVAARQVNLVLVGFHDSQANSTLVKSLGKDIYVQLRGLIAPNKTVICADTMGNALESINRALKVNPQAFTLFVLKFHRMQEYSYAECDEPKNNACHVNAWITPQRIAWIDLSASDDHSLVLPQNHLDVVDLDLISQSFVDSVLELPQSSINEIKPLRAKQVHIQVYHVMGPEQVKSYKSIPKSMLEQELKRIVSPQQDLVVSVESIALASDILLSSAFTFAQRAQNKQGQLWRYLDAQTFYYDMANDNMNSVDVREISVFWFSGVDTAKNPLFIRGVNTTTGLDRIAMIGNMVLLIQSEHELVTRSHLYCNGKPLAVSFAEPYGEALLAIAHVLVEETTRDNWQWAVGAGNAWGRSITNTAPPQVLPLPFVDAVHRRILRNELDSLKPSFLKVKMEELITSNQWAKARAMLLEFQSNNKTTTPIKLEMQSCPRKQTLSAWWKQQINRLR